MTTVNELRKKIRGAGLPARERYVFRALLDRADDKTGRIPDKYQPRGLDDMYFWGVARRTVQRALPHLRDHGWVTWVPWGVRPRDETSEPRTEGRRGAPKSHYTVHAGEPCNCPRRRSADQSSDSVSDAGRRIDTRTGEVIKRQDDAQTVPNRAPGCTGNRAPGCTGIERLVFQESAGQTPDSADRAAIGGRGDREGLAPAPENLEPVAHVEHQHPDEVWLSSLRPFPEKSWPLGSIGAEMNQYRSADLNYRRAA